MVNCRASEAVTAILVGAARSGTTNNADLRNWDPWRNCSCAVTIQQKKAFPLGFDLLSRFDSQRLGGVPSEFGLYYDTKCDPDEINNLADEPEYREHFDRLRRGLRKWIEQEVASGSTHAGVPALAVALFGDATWLLSELVTPYVGGLLCLDL